jgi:hypothetical protein
MLADDESVVVVLLGRADELSYCRRPVDAIVDQHEMIVDGKLGAHRPKIPAASFGAE